MYKFHLKILYRSSHRRCSVKKGVPRNFAKFTGKYLCQSLFFNKVAIKKETLSQVFFCDFCEISRNTFFQNTLWTTASVYIKNVEPTTKFAPKTAFYLMKNTNNSPTNFSTNCATCLYKSNFNNDKIRPQDIRPQNLF